MQSHASIKSELKPVKSYMIYSIHACAKSSLTLCVSAHAGGIIEYDTVKAKHPATICQQVYLGGEKKNHLTGNDLPRVIYEPRSRG